MARLGVPFHEPHKNLTKLTRERGRGHDGQYVWKHSNEYCCEHYGKRGGVENAVESAALSSPARSEYCYTTHAHSLIPKHPQMQLRKQCSKQRQNTPLKLRVSRRLSDLNIRPLNCRNPLIHQHHGSCLRPRSSSENRADISQHCAVSTALFMF